MPCIISTTTNLLPRNQFIGHWHKDTAILGETRTVTMSFRELNSVETVSLRELVGKIRIFFLPPQPMYGPRNLYAVLAHFSKNIFDTKNTRPTYPDQYEKKNGMDMSLIAMGRRILCFSCQTIVIIYLGATSQAVNSTTPR